MSYLSSVITSSYSSLDVVSDACISSLLPALLVTTEDLKASSVAQQPVKKDKEDAPKKKKRGRRALKITNTHMKALVSHFLWIGSAFG